MDVPKRFALIRAGLLVEARYWDLRNGVRNGAWVGIEVSVRMLKYLGMDLEEKIAWGEDTSKKLIEHAGFEEKYLCCTRVRISLLIRVEDKMAHRVIQIGAGRWGQRWCSDFLPANISDGLIEVAAVVDIDPDNLLKARQSLGLREDQCYLEVQKALSEVKADFCTVVVPPAVHEEVVDCALEHDLHILSEKPIADTLLGSVRIAEKVRRSAKKMAVTMSHRFDQDKTTLRGELRSQRHGPLDYLVCRFTCDARKYGTWGTFRHEMKDPLMIAGAVHHLDILADLAEAKCDTIYAETWNPPWGEYAGDSQGLVTMQFKNGVRAFYEGAKTNAVGLNGWSNEYIRAECRDATLVLDRRHLDYFPYDSRTRWATGSPGEGIPIPLRAQKKWANAWLIEKFVDWLKGGEPMETNVSDNLQSVALIFSAIESARTRQPVYVQSFLEKCQEQIGSSYHRDD